MITRRKLFIAAISFQTCAVLWLATPPILSLSGGKTITVVTEPIDPRDMFRGDYISLSYPFSRVTTRETFVYHTKVFVLLKQDAERKWQAISVSAARPAVAADEILLFGESEYTDQSGKQVHIKYGIEQVFVPEGRGSKITSADKLDIELAVPDNGRAVIKRAQMKDNTLYQWKWL